MMRYWGEIPGPSGAPPSRSSFDLLQREFRSVEMQDPPLHQPSAQRPRPTTMLDIPSEPCSLTIHTVQLCQHARRLRALLAAAQGQVFHEVGIGSVLGLQRFWQVRIKDYHTYMLQVTKDLSEEYERLVNPEKVLEDTKSPKIKDEAISDIPFPDSEQPEADPASGDQALPMGVLGAHAERPSSGLDVDHSPHTSGGGGANNSPLWPQVKMEPQDSEEGQSVGHHHHHHHHHGVLGGDVFEEGGPMSTMSESGGAMAPSPSGVASEGSYASHSPDSLMGTSPVFNQRPKKRMKKM